MPDFDSPLTAARLTPAGRGAVATIRLQGDLSLMIAAAAGSQELNEASNSAGYFQAANGLPLWDQPLGKIAFGRWGTTDPEDLVVCRISADIVEIHCHGGDAAVERILRDLASSRCAIVDWRDQITQRTDLFEAEGQAALSRTTTWRTTQIVLEQTNGLLREAYSELIGINSSNSEAIDRKLDELLHWSRFGLHLTKPWNVVLTGRPNVGKSSLINALLGYQRAIVFDEPGTTRDVVTGETAFEGWPVTLADTAGLRNAKGEIEAAGIEMAKHHLAQADLRVVLIDLSQDPTPDDARILADWPEAIVVAHKSDLPDRWGDRVPISACRISSVTRQGIIEFQQELIRKLIPEIPRPGTAIPITARQIDCLHAARACTSVDQRIQLLSQLLTGPTAGFDE